MTRCIASVALCPSLDIMSSDHSSNSGAVLRRRTPSASPITISGSQRGDVAARSRTRRARTTRSMSIVDDAPDRLLLLTDPPGREALVDQLASLQVLRVVHVDHHRDGPVVGADAAGAAEQLGVGRHVLHQVVRRHAPHAGARIAPHRSVGSQPRQLVVRVRPPELAGDQLDSILDALVRNGAHRPPMDVLDRVRCQAGSRPSTRRALSRRNAGNTSSWNGTSSSSLMMRSSDSPIGK